MTYTDTAVEAVGLVKAYDRHPVLSGLDLQVRRGTVHALLGPNGAGKTTAVRILATLLRADAGTARVAGHDVTTGRREVRRRISLTGQFTAVDLGQTGRENLVMIARLCGLTGSDARRRGDDLLARFDLSADADRRVAHYSGGMRRRLDLAAGLIAEPEVVFLDEPTTGLDPRSRRQTWQAVAELAAAGTTVLLTTQYLEEADVLAQRISILDGGRIVAEGSAEQLKRAVGGHRIELVARGRDAADRIQRRLAAQARPALPTGDDAATVNVATDGSARQVRDLLDLADPGREDVDTFSVHASTLDDAFLALTATAPTAPTAPTVQTAREELRRG